MKLDETITRPHGDTHIVQRYLEAHPCAITYCARSLDVKGAEIVEGAVVTCTMCVAAAEAEAEHAETIGRLTVDPAELLVLRAAAARLDALPTDDVIEIEREAPATLIVTQCSKSKLERPAPARDLYRGTLSTMGVAAAESIADSHRNTTHAVFSALHGLLEPSTVVEPYDVTWGAPSAITANEVAAQLAAAGVQRVVALTSNGYAAVLEVACEIAGVELVHALRGCRGIFEQRGRLSRYRRSAGISSRHATEVDGLPDLGLVHAGPLASRS